MAASSAGQSMPPAPLYLDDCCEVHANCVKIFFYWFPTAQTKCVPLAELKQLHPAPERSLFVLDRKTWGMGVGKTWWACAPASHIVNRQENSIVLETSSWCRHGFSTRDRKAAVEAIRNALESQGITVPDAPDRK